MSAKSGKIVLVSSLFRKWLGEICDNPECKNGAARRNFCILTQLQGFGLARMDVPECKNGAARRNFCILTQLQGFGLARMDVPECKNGAARRNFCIAYVRRKKCLPENCSKKILTVFLTDISKCSIYKIIMAFQSQPKEANDDQTEWQAFVNETYGCLADDPIERGEQGVYEIREVPG